MAKKSNLDSQQIALAVCESRTRAEAAERLKIAPRTLFDRLQDREVQAYITAFRADLVTSRLQALEDAQTEALQTVRSILQAEDTSASEKLKAAQLILETGRALRQDIAAADAQSAQLAREAADVITFDPLQLCSAFLDAGIE